MFRKSTFLYLFDIFTPFKTYKFLNDLMRTQREPYANIKEVQFERIKMLLGFTYRYSPFYRDIFAHRKLVPSDIRCKEDLNLLPVIEKEQLLYYYSEFACKKSSMFIRSSGTGGSVRMKTLLDFECASRKFAIYLRHLLNAGWDGGTKILYFLPDLYRSRVVDKQHGLAQMAFTFIQNKVAHDFFTNRKIYFYNSFGHITGSEREKRIFKELSRSRKYMLVGRADFFVALQHYLKRKEVKFIKPKALINIGVLCSDTLKNRLGTFFNCPVFDIYGSSELSYIAGSYGLDRGLRMNEDTHYVEIEGHVSSPGKPGRIIVTDLLNYCMPLIRYSTGDVGYLLENPKNVSALRTLVVAGRYSHCIRLPNNRIITEKDISESVFCDEAVSFFRLNFERNKVELLVEGNHEGIDKNSLALRMEHMGLASLKIVFSHGLRSSIYDKPQYVYLK